MTVQPQPESRKLHHQSIADKTTALLRSMILCGEIKPGERVTQYQLSSMLGVSTMPVREGLLRLAVEGIIEALPNRSFTVVSMSQNDIRDMYWHQGALTGELARRACRACDQALLDQLRSCQESFEEAFRNNDLNQMSRLNWQFHRTINTAAASPRLVRLLRTALRHVPGELYSLVDEWPAETRRGHRELLDRFEERDDEGAAEQAAAHVHIAGELLIANFFANGYWDHAAIAEAPTRADDDDTSDSPAAASL
jgi:DNA-binding GntR family transcriptional regulator